MEYTGIFQNVANDIAQCLNRRSQTKWEPTWNNNKILCSNFQKNDVAEAIIKSTGARITHQMEKFMDEPSYSPIEDLVRIPSHRNFKTEKDYYTSMFHELGHWTGHPKRLGRNTILHFGRPFHYAAEELVAEFTSAFISGLLGMNDIERHAAYLSYQFLPTLRYDQEVINKCANHAKDAAHFILKDAK